MIMTPLSSGETQTDITIGCSTMRTVRQVTSKNAYTWVLPDIERIDAFEPHARFFQTELTKQVSENSFLQDYIKRMGIEQDIC